MTENLFGGVLARGEASAQTADAAWLRAMLEAEAALARALARVGVLEPSAAQAIVAACAPGHFDTDELSIAAAGGGNPVIPLVKRLTAVVAEADPAAARHVHFGATSQDIMDTAAVLVARRACSAILRDASAAADTLAALAERHRETPMAGRTLLQQALPTTAGALAATWLNGLDRAADRLRDVAEQHLAAQLGGAAGTLASLAGRGPAVAAAFAEELALPEAALPWHTERTRLADLAGALGSLCGAVAKTARDITLLAQTEVGEVTETAEGSGGSSTLPHKRNPVAAISALGAARQAPALVATLLAAMEQEHQRAAGAWHAEWLPLRDLLTRTGSATAWLRAALERLTLDPARMRANLNATGGALLAERVTADLTADLGRLEAHTLVRRACAEAEESGVPLAEVLSSALGDRRSVHHLQELLDPVGYLGSAAAFTDRALADHRSRTTADKE